MRKLFSRFLCIGAAAFLVDFCSFAFALKLLDAFRARGFSFLVALVFAWLMNRNFTFAANASSNIAKEFGRYFIANVISGAINLGVYTGLLAVLGNAMPSPYIAMMGGVSAGLIVNFILYSRVVFRSGVNNIKGLDL